MLTLLLSTTTMFRKNELHFNASLGFSEPKLKPIWMLQVLRTPIQHDCHAYDTQLFMLFIQWNCTFFKYRTTKVIIYHQHHQIKYWIQKWQKRYRPVFLIRRNWLIVNITLVQPIVGTIYMFANSIRRCVNLSMWQHLC